MNLSTTPPTGNEVVGTNTSTEVYNMVKDGKTVSLTKIYHGQPWYITECGFEFPIPLHDLDAVFLPKDKALLFMRWIRKHLLDIDSVKNIQEQMSVAEGITQDDSKILSSASLRDFGYNNTVQSNTSK